MAQCHLHLPLTTGMHHPHIYQVPLKKFFIVTNKISSPISSILACVPDQVPAQQPQLHRGRTHICILPVPGYSLILCRNCITPTLLKLPSYHTYSNIFTIFFQFLHISISKPHQVVLPPSSCHYLHLDSAISP